MKFAEEMAANPAGLAIASSLIDPSMISRLESNEAPLDIGQLGQPIKPIE